MPRVTGKAEVVQPANSMVASAVRMYGTRKTVWTNPKEGWQSEAWRFYDCTGELRYAANWVGNVLSRAELIIIERSALGTWEPVTSGPAVDALDELFGGKDGQPQMLKSIGIHLFTPGECYLVGRYPRPERGEIDKGDIWEIISTEEMQYGAGTWQIDYHDGTGPITLDPETETVIRLWNPHPRQRMKADSPVKAQLANLRELELLSRRVAAQATSQVAGNGVTFIPSETEFPPDPDRPNQTAAEGFMRLLGESMLEAIADPTSPAAVVPLVASTPGEFIGDIKHITFWSPFDEQLPALRKEAIGRLAVGLDIPAEVMLGTADMNHWSAWQVEESAIKVNVEPLLETIARCLTVGYLWPITGDSSQQVGFDTSKLRLRPNRSKEAIELWDRGELSSEAMRRETGFDESDAPDDKEYIRWLLGKIASGSATPEMVAQAAQLLGVQGIEPVGQVTNEARPAPTLDEHPVRELPQRNDQAASLRDKAEVLVLRAMERAGNRLKSLKQQRPPCSAHEVYQYVECQVGDLDRVLEDAWSVIPIVYAELPEFERHVVMQALDTYCRHLLTTKQAFDRHEMERYLTTVPIRTLT